MPRRVLKISDIVRNGNPAHANDNYLPSIMNMRDYEAESILAQRDYTKPSKRHQLGLIIAAAICVLVLAVVFVLTAKV
jgi:hypothetical protein